MTMMCSKCQVKEYSRLHRALLHDAIIFNIHVFKIVRNAKNVNLFTIKNSLFKENFLR